MTSKKSSPTNPRKPVPTKKKKVKEKKFKKKKNERYIPSCEDDVHSSDSEDSRPLLDVSNCIEQLSSHWPIDPENQSEIPSDSSIKRLNFL